MSSIQSLPSGYSPFYLNPKIVIKDRDGSTQYTFNSFDENSQDFKLGSWSIQGGINGDHGMVVLDIYDEQNQLTDTTKRERDVLIKPQWTIEVDLGSTLANLNNWFDGIIYDAGLTRPINNMQTIQIIAFGKGIIFSDRLTSINRIQAKEADGLTPDDTDDTAKGTNIMKDLFEDTDHFPHEGLAQPTGFTTTGIVDLDVRFADFIKNSETITSAMMEAANRLGLIWGIDHATQEVFAHHRGTKDSGLLITNNMSSLVTKNWNKQKLCISANRQFGWKSTTIGFGYSIIHGIGAHDNKLDYENASANSTIDLDLGLFTSPTKIAFPFTPNNEALSKIALFLSEISTPTNKLVIDIVGDDGTGSPNDEDDIRRTRIIPSARLQDFGVSGDWFEIATRSINSQTTLSANDQYWVVIHKYGGSNELQIDYQTGTGSYKVKESGTWNSFVGDVKMRTYHSHFVNVILENCQAKKQFGLREISLPLSGFPSVESGIEALKGFSRIVGRKKRIYSPIICSAPLERPLLGRNVRIVDRFNGLDTFVDLTGYNISGNAMKEPRGTNKIQLFLEALSY